MTEIYAEAQTQLFVFLPHKDVGLQTAAIYPRAKITELLHLSILWDVCDEVTKVQTFRMESFFYLPLETLCSILIGEAEV